MRTADRVLTTLENSLAGLALLAITVVAFANVIARYVLDAAFAFTTEITVNLAVWMILLGAVIAVRERAHLGFSLVVDSARGARRRALVLVIGACGVLFFGILATFGWDQVLLQLNNGRATPSLQIPQWLFTLAVPVCGILGILRTVQGVRAQLAEDPDADADDRSPQATREVSA